MFDSMQTHESQHARPPCPSPTPGIHSKSCPSSRWCHPNISSSVVPFTSCPQSLLASESFSLSQLFASGGQMFQLQHQSFQLIYSMTKSYPLTPLSKLYISLYLLNSTTSCYLKTLCLSLASLSVQFSSVAQSCPTLYNPMNHSTPGLPVHHHLPEFTHTHVHRVRDAIQPSHPRSSPSPPAPNPSQHQSLFQWVNSSHEVAKVLDLQL